MQLLLKWQVMVKLLTQIANNHIYSMISPLTEMASGHKTMIRALNITQMASEHINCYKALTSMANNYIGNDKSHSNGK